LKRLALRRGLERIGLQDHDLYVRLGGPFCVQGNSDTRVVEYPWAYHATALDRGMRIVEVGGGLSGFQFTLSRAGCSVVNVDPGGEDQEYWQLTRRLDSDTMARLNRVFDTDVELRGVTLDQAGIADESVDRVFSISTIEHIPEAELPSVAEEIGRILKPDGRCVLTIDLFLDLQPFTTRAENRYGRNADVRAFVAASGLRLLEGDPRELLGFDEFDADQIMRNLGDYFIGSGYPVCAQALVLEKA
jgi:SAM-dependent methyltransferase